ncbi:HIV Tat-specific factor 1 [Cebus imitator]|uniref:17S U2 SnRNP complex component HTATSF1 n=1 Tax=Cebus imitator TaxID=2715852 RepID=A0A2K5Q217_CEBIM|nr:HIV Tat-specific factor 1 [Cebus imitator]XP_017369644.1 HIV Tat-specific factor 1 [Cebus imitator]XP_037589263.1 HIV Tat-specific factor 1 [Cebus imitator]
MSRNHLDGNDEFDEQLRMQELYGDCEDGDPQTDAGGETDSLGQQPTDTPYEWDLDKKAWFPKITEDFIATYQANYGFSNDGASSSTANVQDVHARTAEELPQEKAPEPADPRKKGEKRKAESGWFHVEEDRNTNVYVSGLPPDITVDEFIQLMSKFGIIMRDPQTEEFKVKLYKDNQGNLKGDGLCCYLKRESVELALKLLDEDEIRGYKLHVEVAKFQLKGEYDASKKKKKCKDYKKKLSMQQKQLDWRPERRAGPSRMRHERVVIIKNMFHPMDFEDDPLVLNEIREDLRVECSKFGQIRKLLLFDRHPDGVASVSFRDPEEADYCIQTLDGRWFGGRQITAQAWDGTTDYQVEETSREREERLRGWEAFLNAPESNRGLRRSDSVSASARAGPSRARHFSEHPSTSKMNAHEAATRMAFEEPIDEKKFEKTEDGGEFEEDASENNAKEGGPQNEAEEGCTEKESEGGCPQKECEDGSPIRGSEEGIPKKESKKKTLKNDCEENGLGKESEDDPNKESEEEAGPKKESEEDDSEKESDEDCSEKQSEDGSEREFEENGLEKDLDEDGSEKELPENVLDKELEENDSENSEFEDDGSEKVLDEEGSESEFDENSDEKEEEGDTYEKVFDDESNEKEDEEYADEKGLKAADKKEEEGDADEKLFEESDKEDEDADGKEDEDADEKLFEDDDSNEKLFDEEEDSNEKLFDDSDERGTLGGFGSVEEGPLSTGSSFILSSDDDDI